MNLSLAVLPADVLGQMLSNKSASYLVINLWKAGCRALNAKLALGVVYMHLTDKSWHSTSRYPKMLSSLHNLRYLSIHRKKGSLMPAVMLSKELQSLSPSLRTLRLVGKEVLDAMLNHASDGKLSPTLFVKTQYALGESRLWPMSSVFPHLETLKLKDGESNSFPSLDFAGLPSTLTKLSLSAYFLDDSHNLRLLPRGLLNLDCKLKLKNFDAPHHEDLEHLPPNLTKLRKLDYLVHPNDFYRLPRTLKLDMRSRNLRFDYALARLLLPLTQAIIVSEVDHESFRANNMSWCDDLPRELTSLAIQDGGTLPLETISQLPRTLETLVVDTHLDTGVAEGKEVHDFTALSWPPCLTALNLAGIMIPWEFMKILPETIVDLKVMGTAPFESAFVPRSVRSLELSVRERNFLLAIPPGLPNLHRFVTIQAGLGLDLEQLELPASLTDLQVIMPSPEYLYTMKSPKALPPGLKNFFASNWLSDWVSLLTGLPLERLALFNLIPPLASPISPDILTQLPPSITKLEIERARNVTFSPRSFAALPALVHLAIGACETLPSELVRYLPKKIKIIKLATKLIDPEDAPFFPRHITQWTRLHGASINLPCLQEIFGMDFIQAQVSRRERLFDRFVEAQRISTLYPDPRVKA